MIKSAHQKVNIIRGKLWLQGGIQRAGDNGGTLLCDFIYSAGRYHHILRDAAAIGANSLVKAS